MGDESEDFLRDLVTVISGEMSSRPEPMPLGDRHIRRTAPGPLPETPTAVHPSPKGHSCLM